jgi:hypothetical protein
VRFLEVLTQNVILYRRDLHKALPLGKSHCLSYCACQSVKSCGMQKPVTREKVSRSKIAKKSF